MKICCVIVCYRPHVARLFQLCETLATDGATIVVVDNTEQPYLVERPLPPGCELITLGLNTGIAHAQNVGTAAATVAGADVIVFLDQDSTIEPGFLPALVSPLRVGTPDIVSPLYCDDASKVELPSVIAEPIRDRAGGS